MEHRRSRARPDVQTSSLRVSKYLVNSLETFIKVHYRIPGRRTALRQVEASARVHASHAAVHAFGVPRPIRGALENTGLCITYVHETT